MSHRETGGAPRDPRRGAEGGGVGEGASGGGFIGRCAAALDDVAGLRLALWTLAMTLFAAILDFVPLFNLLGYDFCFALGLASALAAVDIGQGVVAADRRHARTRPLARRMALALGCSVAATLPALAVSLVNALRVRNCNVIAGFEFFLLLPVSTSIYGGAFGVLAGMAWRRHGRLIAFAGPVVSIAWSLWRLYVDPAVFAFDPFGGYFPGPIYDEALRPGGTLVAYRLANAVWLAAGVAVARALVAHARPGRGADPANHRGNVYRASVALLLVAAAVWLWLRRGSLGFHVRESDLVHLLDGERHSNRVVLRYGTAAGLRPSDLDLEMEDLEFRYDQLRETFRVEPSGPITVFQFASADEKKAWVGAGGTLYAKPWKRQIFLQAEGFPARRVRHEMAHVFAGVFGDPVFGVSLAVRWKGPIPVPHLASGLIEGIAEAADFTDPEGGSTTHQEAAAILAEGRATPLAQLMGAGFSVVSGPRAYTLAGSFVRFLLETRGADRLRRIYASAGDFEGVYGVGLDALEAEWKRFLGTQKLSAEQAARAREQFRRPAIFNKVCAREQAARVAEARALMAGAPARAAALLAESCDDDPGEPTLRIELAQAVAASGEPARALAMLGALSRGGELTAPVRLRAASLAASLHFQASDVDNARASVRAALAAATDEGERRLASAKLRALDDEPAQRTLGRALFGDDVSGALDPVLLFYLMTEFARLHPGDPLGPYFVGRQLAARDSRLALFPLRVACDARAGSEATARPAGGVLPGDFYRECLRLLMWAELKTGELAQSRQAAQRLGAASTEEVERLRVGDFLERVAWLASRR